MILSQWLFPSGLALASLSLVAPLEAQQPAPSPSIIGEWQGQSICVKTDWNSACHDEEVEYDFEASAIDSNQVTLHAAKRVNGSFEPMGDLGLHRDIATGQWIGEFANDRVHIRWSYQVQGITLTGQDVELPSLRVAREVRVERVRTGDSVVPQH